MDEKTKAARRLLRKADKINAKAREEIGPLFAEQAPQTTAQEQYWRMRFYVARHAEDGVGSWLVEGMNAIQLQAIERLARILVPEHFEGLQAYCRSTYPSVDYWRSFWLEVLSGSRRVVYRWRLNVPEYPPRVVDDAWFPPDGWTPPITIEALRERFPWDRAYTEPSNPDDNGLSAALFKKAG